MEQETLGCSLTMLYTDFFNDDMIEMIMRDGFLDGFGWGILTSVFAISFATALNIIRKRSEQAALRRQQEVQNRPPT